jgi:hypothetical protein
MSETEDKIKRDIEIREFVLRTLLFEILKDGKIEESERETMNLLFPVLNIPKATFLKIKQEVMKEVSGKTDPEEGSLDYTGLFDTVRKKLLSKYEPEETDNYLEALSKTMNRHNEFMESLTLGF